MGGEAGLGDPAPISALMRQTGARLLRDPTKGLVGRHCGKFLRVDAGASVHQTADGVHEPSGGLDLVRQNGAALLPCHPSLVGKNGAALLGGNGGALVHRHGHCLLN